MQQSVRYSAVLDGVDYKLKPINDDSEAALVPLSGSVRINGNFRNNAGTFGIQIELVTSSGDASGQFVINASESDSGGLNILPAVNGAVSSTLFTSSGLPTLVYVNVPGNFRYLQINWSGASTSDEFRVFVNYNF